MQTLRQAAQAVITQWDGHGCELDADMTVLRTALAAPEQEPVAYFNMAINETVGCIAYEYAKHGLKSGAPLYTAPPIACDRQEVLKAITALKKAGV